MQIDRPILLLLLMPGVVYLLLAARKNYAHLGSTQRAGSLGVRLLVVLLLLASLADVSLLLAHTEESVLCLLDLSDSVAAESTGDAWRQIRDLQGEPRMGLILFAGEALLAIPLQEKEEWTIDEDLEDRVLFQGRKTELETRLQAAEREFAGEGREEIDRLRERLEGIRSFREEIRGDETDLGEALRLARGLFPENDRKRVILFSDGVATGGEAGAEIAFLSRLGISVDVFPARNPPRDEILARRIRLPAQVKKKQPFDVDVILQSTYEGEAELSVYRNKFLVSRQQVSLKVGANQVTLPKVSLEEGFHEFEAVISGPRDTLAENNVTQGVVLVRGRPRILYVEGEEKQSRYLAEALRLEEMNVEVRPSFGFPMELNELLHYDALILSDVAATDLTEHQMRILRSYVRDLGCGFIMLGGENSFGLGGYYRTPVEEILPVKMPAKKQVEKPNLSLYMVLDRSGSMSGVKVQLAKEAAIASAEVLKPRDLVGVVAFDSFPHRVLELTRAREKQSIVDQISRIEAGGGTHIFPALKIAYEELRQTNTKLKHVILLSDGHSEGYGYEDLAREMYEDDVTLSTVAIGEGADEDLLSRMAEAGGGRYYFTSDFSHIPKIFTKETLKASKSMMVEEPVEVILKLDDEIVRGIDFETAPYLLGYVVTEAKPTARQILASDRGDPLLVRWQAGLGKSVAFTSDAKTRWAADWVDWEGFSKLWAQTVRSVMGTGSQHLLQSRAEILLAGKTVRATLDLADLSGRYLDDVDCEAILFEGEERKGRVPMPQVGPGLYEATFPLEKYGTFYRLAVRQKLEGEEVGQETLAVIEPYSPEYRAQGTDLDLLKRLAEGTGGEVEPTPEEAVAFTTPIPSARHPIWHWALILALFLYPLDIALRRFRK